MTDWMPVSTYDTAYMYVRPFWDYYNTSHITYYGGYYSTTTTVEEVPLQTSVYREEPIVKKRRKVATLK